MAKRNVSYIKPQEPEFLKRLKQEAGYVEKDTIETKKQVLPLAEDNEDKEEDQPVVVVLNPGDISAEEAEKIRAKQKEGYFSGRGLLSKHLHKMLMFLKLISKHSLYNLFAYVGQEYS
ncbi:uncharacterized protein KIAA1143 homolog isoform X2 [Anabrus simplex]|uniref:uncharacterized protein KIAA1143 homolog isoform X2 n=1 Tax=Anabrus simplex TaxID=316456 RepID=UPI0035A2AE6D